MIQYGFDWLKGQPVVAMLVTLMILDTIAGTFLALIKKTLNSTTSWRGACKKCIMLLIVGAAGIMQPLLPNVPLMNMLGMFYVITEAISLLENAGAAGVPLPAGLIDTLAKLREQKVAMLSQKGVRQTTTVTVINAADVPPKDGKSTQSLIITENPKP